MMLPRRRIFDLVGEQAVNKDGSGRQAALHESAPGDSVRFEREPENPKDPNAVLIVSARLGVGIGHLSREDAVLWAPIIDAGVQTKARIHELTGGLKEYPSFGCRISIIAHDKAFAAYRDLQGEQIHYRHAPTWRAEPAAKKATSKSDRSKAGRGLLTSLLKSLLK